MARKSVKKKIPEVKKKRGRPRKSQENTSGCKQTSVPPSTPPPTSSNSNFVSENIPDENGNEPNGTQKHDCCGNSHESVPQVKKKRGRPKKIQENVSKRKRSSSSTCSNSNFTSENTADENGNEPSKTQKHDCCGNSHEVIYLQKYTNVFLQIRYF